MYIYIYLGLVLGRRCSVWLCLCLFLGLVLGCRGSVLFCFWFSYSLSLVLVVLPSPVGLEILGLVFPLVFVFCVCVLGLSWVVAAPFCFVCGFLFPFLWSLWSLPPPWALRSWAWCSPLFFVFCFGWSLGDEVGGCLGLDVCM